MILVDRWIAHLRRFQPVQIDGDTRSEIAALTKAQGAALALIAALLDREKVIFSDDFAECLAGLADATAADRPNVGDILSRWASCVEDVRSAASMPVRGH